MVTEIFDKSYVYVQAALPCTPKCLFCFYAAKWWPRHFHRGNFYNRTKLDRWPTTMHLESQLRKKNGPFDCFDIYDSSPEFELDPKQNSLQIHIVL